MKRTARVYLSAPTPADQAEVLALNRRSRAFHRHRVIPPITPEQFRSFLRAARRPDALVFLVRRASDRNVLGAVEITQIVRGPFKSAYLGYHLGAPYAGQGYMTEALELVLRRAFRDLRLHRLEAHIQPTNEDSRRLVRRLGFRLEGFSPRYLKLGGRWMDHERWAILAEDWRRSRARRRP